VIYHIQEVFKKQEKNTKRGAFCPECPAAAQEPDAGGKRVFYSLWRWIY
jgi:hypothetical protein